MPGVPLNSLLENKQIQGSKTSAEKRESSVMNNFEDLIKMTLETVKNQDPMEPMDAHELSAQLAQTVQSQELLTLNKKIDSLIENQKVEQTLAASSQIGKDAEYEGDQFFFGKDGTHDIKFEVPVGAKGAKARIFDMSGKKVREIDFEKTEKDQVKTLNFQWDGNSSEGHPMPEGVYRVAVNAFDDQRKLIIDPETNQPLSSTTRIRGKVTSLQSGDGEPRLLMNGAQIKLSSLSGIYQPQIN